MDIIDEQNRELLAVGELVPEPSSQESTRVLPQPSVARKLRRPQPRVFRAIERLLFDSLWPEFQAFVNAPEPGSPEWIEARNAKLAEAGIISIVSPADDTQGHAAIWRIARRSLDDIIAGRLLSEPGVYPAPLVLQVSADGKAWWAVGGIGAMDWERRVRFTVVLLGLPGPRAMLKRCGQCGRYLMRARAGRAFCTRECKEAHKVEHRDKADHARRERKRRADRRNPPRVVAVPAR